MFNLTIVGINFEIDVIFSECRLLVMHFILYILPLSIVVCAASLTLFSVGS